MRFFWIFTIFSFSCAPMPPGGSLDPQFNELSLGREPVQQSSQRTIYQRGPGVFHFRLDHGSVWEVALDTLLKNYNLTVVDRPSGVVTTEWDRFFYKGSVYRNRVSVRIKEVGFGLTQLSMINNIETLKSESRPMQVSSVWVPSIDVSREADRLIKSMSARLGQPPPQLSPPKSATLPQNFSNSPAVR